MTTIKEFGWCMASGISIWIAGAWILFVGAMLMAFPYLILPALMLSVYIPMIYRKQPWDIVGSWFVKK